jgi:hypothetical protein
MSKSWSTFYDYVMPELQGVTTALVDFAVRQIVIDFFDETGIYTETLSDIAVLNATATYSFSGVPSGYDVDRVTEMKLGQRRIIPSTPDVLRTMYLDWQAVTGTPAYYIQETQDTFRLVPEPDQDFTDALSVRGVLKATQSSSSIPDWIWENYVNTMAAGVKGTLMTQVAKPWTNLERGAAYLAEYHSKRGQVRIDQNRSLTRATMRVQMRKV